MSLYANIDVERGAIVREKLGALVPEIAVVLPGESFDPAKIDYLFTWALPPDIATGWLGLKAIFSLGAGADQFTLSQIPTGVPVVRMIDEALTAMMQEYVTMSVLALHRDLPGYLDQQRRQIFARISVPPVASKRRVGVMGLGELGRASLRALAPFGFALSGWARGAHKIEGVRTFQGPDGLHPFLAQCDILICLLPLTPATVGILDSTLFAQLPRGAALIHVGRGLQLDHAALMEALDSGQLRAAVLDVTEPEPLPQGHFFWSDPRILLTPHIACITRIESYMPTLAHNIRMHRSGNSMRGLVDRERGY